MSRAYRNNIFRVLLAIFVLLSIELIGYMAMYMNSRSFDFLSNKSYFQIRAMLMGCMDSETSPRYLSAPFLGYIPYPGYKKCGVTQHNKDGYRGERIALEKQGKFRILCLGGSTTYGFGVDSPYQTYPAQLEKIIDQYIVNDALLHTKYIGAEVLNAGIEAGTSAEELQQYLFKYRYYKPDAVIVNSGINDAQVACSFSDNYQFDYTHYRRLNFHHEPLVKPASYLLHSYFFSYLTIRLFFSDFSNQQDQFAHQYPQTFCKWTTKSIDSIMANNEMEYYPFYMNSESLYSEIIRQKSKLYFLPCLLNNAAQEVKSNPRYKKATALNNAIGIKICTTLGGVVLNFDSVSDSKLWIDDCHLNAQGEHEKASIIAKQLIDRLNEH